ncbi:holin family protein [Sediminimonas sp.]|uniref:holin family protein n=1 Tax=Sediminimonas sp. TaxID=2823379 RepID=UPI0025F197AA|nr:holin family protein [Sediminimonas sp.]
MGLIGKLIGALFGGGRNVITETVETFRPNAEAADQREAGAQRAALEQMAAEFDNSGGWFNSLIDGINRIPRPAMALGTIGLFVAAMVDPVWFSSRMRGLALVPDQLWLLLGAIITFYFGARYSAKHLQAGKAMAAVAARTPQVVEDIEALRSLNSDTPGAADTGSDAKVTLETVESAASDNPAVRDWRRESGR